MPTVLAIKIWKHCTKDFFSLELKQGSLLLNSPKNASKPKIEIVSYMFHYVPALEHICTPQINAP